MLNKPEYDITDFELCGKVTRIRAWGVMEAMREYLPWNDVNITVLIKPGSDNAQVTDNQTDFQYQVDMVAAA